MVATSFKPSSYSRFPGFVVDACGSPATPTAPTSRLSMESGMPTDEVDLAGINVHDPEVSVGRVLTSSDATSVRWRSMTDA